MVQGNYKPRAGTGCETDNGNGSSTQTIEPEVLPPMRGPAFPMALGQNGMVDGRLFYFMLGAVVVGGFFVWCDRRKG